jgi:phosphohistidine phosphatase SixA
MSLYLVRHAKAGSRSDWTDDDELRPLSKNGWKQAEGIAKRLSGKRRPSALLSSPYVRCQQTLEPLATASGLTVVVEPRLTEGSPFEPVLELLSEVDDGTVLCSHGDVVPDTIAALQRRGCTLLTGADWRKATVWTIERDADGTCVSAGVWGPPD